MYGILIILIITITSFLKQRLRDQYVQNWYECINSQSKLEYYCKFKNCFKYEKYLDVVDNAKYRIALSRLRLCSHSLEIESGRYNNIDRTDRICKLCNMNVVESEFHFVLCCPLYTELRRKYNMPCAWSTINKFVNIMSSNNVKCIRNLAKYVHFAMLKRSEALNNVAS